MRFDGFIGNTELKARLSAACAAGKLSHGFLLCGVEGSGRHTLARIIASAMQCEGQDAPCGRCSACRKIAASMHPDVITVNDPEHKQVSVDVIREMRADVFIRPNEGKRKIYIIEQSVRTEGQNALLKVLEEPPQYAAFIILATHPDAVLPTIRSRCVTLHLSPVRTEEALVFLQNRCPNATREELLTAHARAGGYLGRAMALVKEASDAKTTEFAKYFANGGKLSLLSLLVSMEKQKRLQLTDTFSQWRELLSSALAAKNGAPATPLTAAICARHTGAELLAACRDLQTAIDALDLNVGTGAVSGLLSAKLCT